MVDTVTEAWNRLKEENLKKLKLKKKKKTGPAVANDGKASYWRERAARILNVAEHRRVDYGGESVGITTTAPTDLTKLTKAELITRSERLQQDRDFLQFQVKEGARRTVDINDERSRLQHQVTRQKRRVEALLRALEVSYLPDGVKAGDTGGDE